MTQFCRSISENTFFQRFILGLIILAGVLIGLETDAGIMARWGNILHALDRIVLGFFVIELLLRIGAHGGKPWEFLRDPWNVFDFAIVVICLLPMDAQFAAVLRLARILRVLRLLTAVPRLQILVGALLKSIPSMSHVAMLLGLLFYMYATVGVMLFGRTSPEYFGSLGTAALTLFQTVTLEGWADILQAQIAGTGSRAVPVLYFVSFILIGTMIMLNLLIGVIVSSMDEAREEMEDTARKNHLLATGETAVSDDLAAMEKQISELQEKLTALRRRLR